MLLTSSQTSRFWREWSSCIRLHNWSKPDSETQRKALLQRAGFTSLTQVDKLAGFDRVLSELAAITRPSDIAPQIREAEMPRTRLIYACRQLADEAYIISLAASDRFKCHDWLAMPMDTLLQLRHTLSDRAVGQHRHDTLSRRRTTAAQRPPTAPKRQTFPDLTTASAPDPF